MGMLSRIRADILVKLIIGIVIAFFVAAVPNFQKYIYQKMKPLTASEVNERTVQKSIGYLPAKDIQNSGSVEEIKAVSYCTIKVKTSDLHPTGYYKILDESKVGVKEGTGRKTPRQNRLKYKSNHFAIWLMNNVGPQYGQFYVAKLESGEQIIVLLDQTVLSYGKSKEIQLPIGRKADKYPTNFFESISEKYNLGENGTWYVDMAGNNFINSTQMEKLGIIRFGVGILSFILSYLILTVCFSIVRKR